MSKICKKCGVDKDESEFYIKKNKNKFSICKVCVRLGVKKYQKDNSEKEKLRMKKYYKNNSKKRKEYSKEYKKKNPECIKMWRKNNKDRSTYINIRNKAKTRNIEFLISFNDFRDIYFDKKCFYCDDRMMTGLDRIDNSRGYEKNNVIQACSICNKMKLDHSLNNFFSHIEKILKRKEVIGKEVKKINKLII